MSKMVRKGEVRVSRLLKDEELAGWWHLTIGLLYLGALVFHVIGALEHFNSSTERKESKP